MNDSYNKTLDPRLRRPLGLFTHLQAWIILHKMSIALGELQVVYPLSFVKYISRWIMSRSPFIFISDELQTVHPIYIRYIFLRWITDHSTYIFVYVYDVFCLRWIADCPSLYMIHFLLDNLSYLHLYDMYISIYVDSLIN